MVVGNGVVRLVTFACLGGLVWTVGTAVVTGVEPTLADAVAMIGAGSLLWGVLGAVVGGPFAGGEQRRGDYTE